MNQIIELAISKVTNTMTPQPNIDDLVKQAVDLGFLDRIEDPGPLDDIARNYLNAAYVEWMSDAGLLPTQAYRLAHTALVAAAHAQYEMRQASFEYDDYLSALDARRNSYLEG